MADVFKLGQEASKSAFVSALTNLQTQGAGVLDVIEAAYTDTLVEFDRRLQATNARRVRASRTASPEEAITFVTTDFSDIDQSNTTSTIRADSASVSLRERALPVNAAIKSNNFSANKGTIEALDSAQNILRVHTDDFSTPTGQFDIELLTPLTLSQLVVDIVASPSSPMIVASISADGLTYTPATQVAVSGYRINIWLPSQETRFIRIQITPSHPDDLNGNTFTFGITNFSAQATSYHLRSELLSKVLSFAPQSEFVVFDATQDSRIQYYLSLYDATLPATPLTEIVPGTALQIGTLVTSTVVTSSSVPSFLAGLPSNVYKNTIVVKENGIALRFAPDLSPSDPKLTQISHEYVVLDVASIGYNLTLLRGDGIYAPPRTFTISYIYGPALAEVQLKVRLTTDDQASSPVFHGASLSEF